MTDMFDGPPSTAPAPDSPAAAVDMLLRLLDVEQVGPGPGLELWRGMRKPGGVGRVFGGQVIAQALMAATKSVELAFGPAFQVHSLHAYFLRGGDEDYPIDFRVEADFDGRSFVNRRVVAMQKDQAILNLAASFQRRETGYAHQVAILPDVPPPEELMPYTDHIANHAGDLAARLPHMLKRHLPLDMRSVGVPSFLSRTPGAPVAHMWLRMAKPVAVEQSVHRAILAYASDFQLLGTSLHPHGVTPLDGELQVASLDHAMWFHDDIRADEWLLYATESPWAGQARGFNRGMFFTRDGRLVASAAQEGLIRPRPQRVRPPES